MSATSLISRELGPDEIRRYRTRFKILVHSHNSNNVIDLSKSVVRVNTNKNVKSVGSLSLDLTADRNWLNFIYPNDYINVYVDRADGQGWVRLFYGFVDQIEESTAVGGDGIPLTTYSLSGSDFQKAFEKTQIYFNPHVASRADFNGGFVGTPNIGGLGLMTRGVRINGSPADLVTNITLLLLGFGSQFILPTSYNPRLVDRIRAQRAEFILDRLSEDARRQVVDAGGYAAFLERLRIGTNTMSDIGTLTDPDSTSANDMQLAERAAFSEAAIRRLGGSGSAVGVENSRASRERGIEAYNVLNTTLQGYPPTLLDVVDIFTFIERRAIDGYLIGAPLWEHQGSVMNMLRSVSNEVVNELFFDLRAVSRDGGLTAGTDFSRDLDEIEGNRGTETAPNGIQYIPAIVMREYPFATIDRIDASDISMSLHDPAGTTENFGQIYFGAIFSDQPNTPGRHIVHVPNLNPDDQVHGAAGTSGQKHLDVAVISTKEIVKSKLSRSDEDHYNLFEFYSDAILGNDARFFMQDLLPIITPVHVVRHGLRVRSLTTRFGRFSLDTVNRTTHTAAEPEDPPEEAAPTTPPASTNRTVLPVELIPGDSGRYTQGYVTRGNTWRYRQKTFDGSRPVNNAAGNSVPPAGARYWRFHNGVDISGDRGTPIRAVRDGRVVLAAPVGTSGTDGYGTMVVIYHPDIEMYTVYAHLDSLASNLAITSRSRRLVDFAADEYISGGRFTPVNVSAGDVIGTMGDSNYAVHRDMGVHLHFEFNVVRNGRSFPSSRDRRTLTPDYFRDASTAVAGFPFSPGQPPQPDETQTISQDPVRVFMERWGMVLPVGPAIVDTDVPDTDLPDEALFPGDEAEDALDNQHEVAPTPTQTEETTTSTTTMVGHVDTPSTRRQIARWALLNDHWYQHNLEYLAGPIELRGAPEIRAGYRLDIAERNLSLYVEGVSHNWTYGRPMSTTLQVSRGQPTNPHAGYVLPFINGFDPTETQRQTGSRLATYFMVPDPLAVRRATKLESRTDNTLGVSLAGRRTGLTNTVDTPAENQSLSDKYGEQILPAVVVDIPLDLQQSLNAEMEALGLRGYMKGGATTATETNPIGGIDSAVVEELMDVVA